MRCFSFSLFLFLAWFPLCQAGEVHPFLKEILAGHPSVRDLTLRSDGKEAYFSSQSLYGEISAIMRLRKIDGQWKAPELAAFSGEEMDLEPFLSPDGLRLYFASNRPSEKTGDSRHFDIWVVERSGWDKPWSAPVNLGSPVNTPGNEFYPAVTREGHLYFTRDGPGSKGKDDIFVSRFHLGRYSEPESLPESINTDGYEFNAFVAPDDSYLLFTAYNREDGHGSGDLYISERAISGEWTPAKNLGTVINSSRMDYCPFVDMEGNLYFTSKRVDFPSAPYGVSTEAEWLEIVDQTENGQSRLYHLKDFVPAFLSR